MENKDYHVILLEDVYNEENEFVERVLGVLADSQHPNLDGGAYDLRLKRNVNGLNEFSFKMPSYYHDKTTRERTLNFRYRNVVAEKKVRVRKNDTYYDFVIKTITEERSQNDAEIVSVTCQDAAISELSKKGWALYFDEENGMGNIKELGPKVLVGTDWEFDAELTDTLYETEYKNSDGENVGDGETENRLTQKHSYTVEQGTLYHYEGSRAQLGIPGSPDWVEVVKWQEQTFVQTEVGRNLLSNGHSFYTTDSWTSDGNLSIGTQEDGTYTRFLRVNGKSPITNNSLDRKNFKFNVGDKYSFMLTHRGPATTYTIEISDEWGTFRNVVTRQSFSVPASNQWKTFGFSFTPKITGYFNMVFVQSSSSSTVEIGKVRLELGALNGVFNSDFGKNESGWTFETVGENNYRTFLKNYEYRDSVLKTNQLFKTNTATPTMLAIDGKENCALSFDIKGDAHGSVRCTLITTKNGFVQEFSANVEHGVSFSRESATFRTVSLSGYDNIVVKFEPSVMTYITNIKFESGEPSMWTPAMADEITLYPYSPIAQYVTKNRYAYLEPGGQVPVTLTTAQENKLTPLLEVPIKVRALIEEKSNCFNLVQGLAELFEAWPVYYIERNPDGSIKRDPVTNKRVKKIYFKENVGRDLPYGFEYRLDLLSVKREINTNNLATKIYVENSEFEHAKDGIVSIAQAVENPSREPYILNLDYYIDMGILSTRTRYDVAEFEAKMKVFNIDLDREQHLAGDLRNEFTNSIIPQLSAVSISVIALEESIRSIEHQIGNSGNADTSILADQKTYYQQLLADAIVTKAELEKKQEIYEAQLEELDKKITTLLEQKKAVEKVFIEKYAPYIHEASWSDDTYINPDMYYRDALSVAKRSAYPEISYDIKVASLDNVEGFEYRTFEVGDNTFVRDHDLMIDKEDLTNKSVDLDVFISEIEDVLDDPKETTITVHNFTTRFEEIFQRIIASIESLRLMEKVYDRSKNFKETGEIEGGILQNTLDRNNIIVAQSQDGSFEVTPQGVTVRDKQNPLRMVKIIPGGIFITKDGVNWKAGLTPDGLSIDELTAGVINTENIIIYNDSQPRFYWDATGLNAYGVNREGKTDYNTRITFNHEGLIFRRTEDEDNAELSLTWDGLAINLQDGAVKIGSSAGIVVEDNQKTPIKRVEIGKINRVAGESPTFHNSQPEMSTYGMVLRNQDNMETMITSDTGELWLLRALSIGNQGTQDMAGITGVTKYTRREIKNFVRNFQYTKLEEAQTAENEEEIQKWTEAIIAPIPVEIYEEFRKELEEDPIRFWSGSNSPGKATFKVRQSGSLYATRATIEGDITATSGHFTGRVYMGKRSSSDVYNSGAGLSGSARDTVRIWAGAPLGEGATESEPEEGLFKVYNNGKVYATNMDVHGLLTTGEKKSDTYTPTFFISGEQHKFSGVLTRHPVEPNLMARLWAGGDTPNKANLVITSDGSFYGSDVHLSGTIEGEGLRVAKIRINDSGIYTENYSPGVVGDGWFINNDGSADFQNVRVRGEISTSVFTKNTVQAAGGNLLIRPATVLKSDSVVLTQGNSATFEIDELDLISVGDNLFFSEGAEKVKGRVTGVTANTITINVLEGNGVYLKGSPVVNFGSNGSGGILISAAGNRLQNTGASLIDFFETVETDTSFSERMVVRVGDLNGLVDGELPLAGYGLYAENVSLRGNLFMKKAGMYNGNEIVAGERLPIRIWVGTDFKHRGEANFKVYEDGSVLARNGIFEGKIIADEGGFSGSVGLGGITINDNTGSFYIEKRNGNTDVFHTIATFGSDGITIYDGGIRVFKSGTGDKNTYQYIYPYMFAVNDTDGNNERIVSRQAHFWSFEKEDMNTPEGEVPPPSMNYSVRTAKAGISFAQGLTANQDKTTVKYFVDNFSADSTDGFFKYAYNSTELDIEKTTSYMAIDQLNPLKSKVFEMRVQDYKAITLASGEREYEMAIVIESEYDSPEQAFFYVEYVPNANNTVPERLKYELPKLKNTPLTLLKNLRVYNYGPNDKLELQVYVENTRGPGSSNNRILVKSISMKEITVPVLMAEQEAYRLPEKTWMGLNDQNQFLIRTAGRNLIFDSVNESGKTELKVGINTGTPDHALHIIGDEYLEGYLSVQGEGTIRDKLSVIADGTNYTVIEKGTINISNGPNATYINLSSTHAVGHDSATTGLAFYTADANASSLIHPTVMPDAVTGSWQGAFSIRRPDGQAQNLQVTGQVYAAGNVRIPVTRYGTGDPANSLYPHGPKQGDVYIRY